MTTVLQARPRQFVSTPSVERIAARALRYLQSGYSVHLRGPAGTGKTTLAMHLADLLSRPIMLLFGDDEYKTSDLIGNQSGYTRKKVVDNFIHSVIKVEDEMRQTWVDSRLTLACREGFTLVYDEFNRSRPEVNNVLLSALEEKLIVLPPSGNRPEYIRVNPHFRGIFTSNPEEYCGVHGTQDALMDRLITINMPEPDELTQQEILVQKTNIERSAALAIVRLVKTFQRKASRERASSLRASMMIAKVCQEHDVRVVPEDVDFRDTCSDILLSRAAVPVDEARQILWTLFNSVIVSDLIVPGTDLATEIQELTEPESTPVKPAHPQLNSAALNEFNHQNGASNYAQNGAEIANAPAVEAVKEESQVAIAPPPLPQPPVAAPPSITTAANVSPSPLASKARTATLEADSHASTSQTATPAPAKVAATQSTATNPVPSIKSPDALAVYNQLGTKGPARLSQLEATLGFNRFQTVTALKHLAELGLITQVSGQGKPSMFKLR